MDSAPDPPPLPEAGHFTALEKHSCPACGAQAEWNARKQMLVCPFCGTESPAVLDTDAGKIREHDLATALREMPEDWRGWGDIRKTVLCQACKAVTVFDADRVGKNCDFCGSPQLIDYEEVKPPIRPESLLPFVVHREQVYSIVKDWLGKRWFAPSNLKRRSLVDQTHGIYIPYWTFDSQVDCPWTAESGDYYYVPRTVRDANGNTRVVQERRIRWYSSSGRVDHVFDDHLIPASTGIRPLLLRKIEPFPTGELRPYDTGYVSGWDIEHYQVVLLEAARQAHEEKTRVMQQLASRQVPGDTHRNLQIRPLFSRETFKHILAPVWLITYDYGRKRSFQVAVNGATGAIAGEYPRSPWKIAFLVLVILVVLATILYFGSSS